MTSYQQKVAWYYSSRVKSKIFWVGDLVLRRAEISNPTEQGKLFPNWEDSYRIYKIENLDDTEIPRMWNINNLWMYYQ